MNKNNFLKKLEKNLRYLNKKELKEELAKYNDLTDYSLDPTEEANKIYIAKNINIKLTKKIKLFDAVNIIIEAFKSKNKDIITKLILFFLYTLFVIIIIKIPFIYTRDMILNLFNNLFKKEISFTIWNLFIELIYTISSIYILIRLIKKKSLEIKN